MEIVDRRVPLSEIGKTVGPAPVPRFVANVRRNGVIIPILLREVVGDDGSVTYRVVDGNRRIAAARQVGLRDLPARVLIGVSVDEAARLVLLANNFRSANDITEYWALRHLQQGGASRQSVADDGGFEVRYLHQRDRWGTLDRRIFTGYAEGRIPSSIATRIVRMETHEQRYFGDLFARTGRILSADIDEYRRDRTPPRSRSARPEPALVHAEAGSPGGTASRQSDGPYGGLIPDASREATIDATTGATGTVHRRAEILSVDVRQVIETVAEVGYLGGYSLDDLMQALEVAYRQVALAHMAGREESRGPDQ